jgi:hypothetical protein
MHITLNVLNAERHGSSVCSKAFAEMLLLLLMWTWRNLVIWKKFA